MRTLVESVPISLFSTIFYGRLAQLVERLLYTQDVRGSSPLSPTPLYLSLSQECRIPEKWSVIEMDITFQQTVEAYLDAIKNRDLQQLLTAIAFDEDIDVILFNGTHFKGRALVANLHSALFADSDWKLEAQIVR